MKTYVRLLVMVMSLAMLVACCPKKGDRGPSGAPGTPGNPGSNGHSAAFKVDPADISLCDNGGTVISAGVDTNDDAVLQTLEITAVAVLCNGLDGSDGTNGTNAPPTAFTPVGLVNPCGDAPGIDDEVFIKLQNGTLLWSQSDTTSGNNTRLAVSRPGTWTTTDNDHCTFTLDASFNITYENHHY